MPDLLNKDLAIVGWMVGTPDNNPAMYNLAQKKEAFKAAQRWNRPITALVISPAAPDLPLRSPQGERPDREHPLPSGTTSERTASEPQGSLRESPASIANQSCNHPALYITDSVMRTERLPCLFCQRDDAQRAAEYWKAVHLAANAKIERLTKALRITELKASGTLANNLCPDHRDKQTGKPCLACEIERLRNGFSHSIRIAKEQHSEIERQRAGLEMIAGERYEQQYQRAPSLAEAQRIARAALAGSSVETKHHLTRPERDALNRAADLSVTEVHPGIPPEEETYISPQRTNSPQKDEIEQLRATLRDAAVRLQSWSAGAEPDGALIRRIEALLGVPGETAAVIRDNGDAP